MAPMVSTRPHVESMVTMTSVSVPPGQRSDGHWWGHLTGQLTTAVTAIHTEVVSGVVVDFRYRHKLIFVFLTDRHISIFNIDIYLTFQEEEVDLKDMINYSLHPRTSKKFRHIHFLRKHVLFYFPILLTLHPPDSPGTQIKLCNQ